MQDPAAQAVDQPGFLQQRDEHIGRHGAGDPVFPAQQGLEAAQPTTLDMDLRLVDQVEILLLDGVAQAFLQHQPGAGPAVHLRRVEAVLLAPGTLGLVHGDVRRAQQAVDALPAFREAGDADTGAKGDVYAFDAVAHRDHLDQLFRHPRGVLGVVQGVEQRGELVAAHAREDVVGTQAALQLFGHPPQHAVAGIVAEGVVDQLESVQVQVQHRHALAVALDARQGSLQRLVEAAAVEQPGQGVGDGLGLQLRMQLTHRRHVQGDHHHRALQARQWRGRKRHWQAFAGQGLEAGVVQAVGLVALPVAVEVRFAPVALHLRVGDQLQQRLAFQVLHRALEHLRHGGVGEVDQAVLADHQDALGGILQHRGIEGAGAVQLLAEQQQVAAVAFVAQQRLDLVPQYLGIEGFEDEVHRAGGVSLQHGVLGVGDGGDEDDRREAGQRAAAHQAGDFEAVHARHLHVQQDQADLFLEQAFQCRLAGVHRAYLPFAVVQQRLHRGKVFLAVVHHQQDVGHRGLLRLQARHGDLPVFPASGRACPAVPGGSPAWPGSRRRRR
ncbi:hypothetical protein FQZ97_605890 [compost metagenome]